MSDLIKHECGIALIRLLKPLEYYKEKYGTPLYGFNKLFMLMEKQHNRGQDGAGIGCVKLHMPVGKGYMNRERSTESDSLGRLFREQLQIYQDMEDSGIVDANNIESIKNNWDFGGELFLGHLRYGTSGNYSRALCHPYIRRSNWPTRNLMLAGNFNMTNHSELNHQLVNRGQHPIFDTDTQIILEIIGSQLDEEHSRIYRQMRDEGVPGLEIPGIISEKLDPVEIIRSAAESWDGGYVIAGLIGNGDSFVMRDPLGIRPGYYYQNDEIIAVTSERVCLMTVFGIAAEEVNELKRGHVLVIKNDGRIYDGQYCEIPESPKGCSFERIYMSRGNDPEIYQERKAMGAALAQPVLNAIDGDLTNTIIGYIPNTAESAYYGLMEKLRELRRLEVRDLILKAHKAGTLTEKLVDDLIMHNWPRREKLAIKDIKLRTFISQEKDRLHLASHVYDVTYGIVKPTDTIVCVDDSIVRGTTLKQSILKILGSTNPKKIIITSTSPQIRYPDCYGIDMADMSKFIAFQAVVELLKESHKSWMIDEVYEACSKQFLQNHVKRLYDEFTDEQVSKKIAELVFPVRESWHGELQIIFQTVEDLHKSLRKPSGDWYFTGNYPTPGGYAVLNRAFMNYYEKRSGRGYEGMTEVIDMAKAS